jgi:UDP-2-acetamido-2-deoxy-ribo-hexuluronate aminotransferase
MDFIDLKTQQALIKSNIDRNISNVLDHGKYIMGPEIAQLEEQLANYVGVEHCIGVSSGTDALLVAMMALGIGHGDEVITTPFTFIATGEMIALLGAMPVFVDIDPRTYNIDPAKITSAITPKTKAIMPVSLYGQCAEFDAINQIAEQHKIPVIEDGCQSFGATYKDRFSCGLSTIGCTSFFPSKPLGGYGDSGACFTNDDGLAKVMREIRVHGQDRRYHHPRIGLNARMDTIQAAILLAKFELFPDEVIARARIGEQYTKLLNDAQLKAGENAAKVEPPYIESYNTSVFAQYTVLVENRSALQERLKQNNIPTAVHYPVPLHQQPALQLDVNDLGVAEQVSEKVMSLPMHPYLEQNDLQIIVDVMIDVNF